MAFLRQTPPTKVKSGRPIYLPVAVSPRKSDFRENCTAIFTQKKSLFRGKKGRFREILFSKINFTVYKKRQTNGQNSPKKVSKKVKKSTFYAFSEKGEI